MALENLLHQEETVQTSESHEDTRIIGKCDEMTNQLPILQLLQATMQMDGESVSDDTVSIASREAPSIKTLERIAPPEMFDTVAEKLQYAFELPQVEEFKDEFACWLCRSVLLRGFIFLTDQHICFWANISGESERIQKASFLKKRSGVIVNSYYTSWFVLEKGMICSYADSTVFIIFLT
jgi:hypothetical protein